MGGAQAKPLGRQKGSRIQDFIHGVLYDLARAWIDEHPGATSVRYFSAAVLATVRSAAEKSRTLTDDEKRYVATAAASSSAAIGARGIETFVRKHGAASLGQQASGVDLAREYDKVARGGVSHFFEPHSHAAAAGSSKGSVVDAIHVAQELAPLGITSGDLEQIADVALEDYGPSRGLVTEEDVRLHRVRVTELDKRDILQSDLRRRHENSALRRIGWFVVVCVAIAVAFGVAFAVLRVQWYGSNSDGAADSLAPLLPKIILPCPATSQPNGAGPCISGAPSLCVQCANSSNCPSMEACLKSNGQCGGCSTDQICVSRQPGDKGDGPPISEPGVSHVCNGVNKAPSSGVVVPSDSTPVCELHGCTTDEQCASAAPDIPSTKAGDDPRKALKCLPGEPGVSSRCVECVSDSDCSPPPMAPSTSARCDPATNMCITDCSDPRLVLFVESVGGNLTVCGEGRTCSASTGSCVTGCSSVADCDQSEVCVASTSSCQRCDPSTNPTVLTTGSASASADGCNAANPLCAASGQKCVQCLSTADCATGLSCVASVCETTSESGARVSVLLPAGAPTNTAPGFSAANLYLGTIAVKSAFPISDPATANPRSLALFASTSSVAAEMVWTLRLDPTPSSSAAADTPLGASMTLQPAVQGSEVHQLTNCCNNVFTNDAEYCLDNNLQCTAAFLKSFPNGGVPVSEAGSAGLMYAVYFIPRDDGSAVRASDVLEDPVSGFPPPNRWYIIQLKAPAGLSGEPLGGPWYVSKAASSGPAASELPCHLTNSVSDSIVVKVMPAIH